MLYENICITEKVNYITHLGKILLKHPQTFYLSRKGEGDEVIQPVFNGPVKLLRQVGSQD